MRSLLIGLTAALAVAGLAAQQPPAPTVTGSAQSVAPATVEAAEAEGAKWPRNPPQAERTSWAWANAFGPRERQCVRAADHDSIRSGDFVIGPFKERVVMMAYAGKFSWKIWWVPNQMPPGAALTMRATKLDQPEKTVTEYFGDIANQSTAEPFFPTLVRFPEKGLWLAVVTAGNNWGCFIIEETLA